MRPQGRFAYVPLERPVLNIVPRHMARGMPYHSEMARACAARGKVCSCYTHMLVSALHTLPCARQLHDSTCRGIAIRTAVTRPRLSRHRHSRGSHMTALVSASPFARQSHYHSCLGIAIRTAEHYHACLGIAIRTAVTRPRLFRHRLNRHLRDNHSTALFPASPASPFT